MPNPQESLRSSWGVETSNSLRTDTYGTKNRQC